VRFVRGITDLPAAVTEIRQGRLSLRAYLRSLAPPLECAVFALNDPLPALVDVPSLLCRFWRYRRTGALSLEQPEALAAAMREGLRS
jgi:predicted ATP-grasp superfamily ATP-dependent carboligase